MGLFDMFTQLGDRSGFMEALGQARAEVARALDDMPEAGTCDLSPVPFEHLPRMAPRPVAEVVADVSARAARISAGERVSRADLVAIDHALQRADWQLRAGQQRRTRWIGIGVLVVGLAGALATWALRRAQPLEVVAVEMLSAPGAWAGAGAEPRALDPAWLDATLTPFAEWYFGRRDSPPAALTVEREVDERKEQVPGAAIRVRLRNPSHGAPVFVSYVAVQAKLREQRPFPWARIPMEPDAVLEVVEPGRARLSNEGVGPLITARWTARAGAIVVAQDRLDPDVRRHDFDSSRWRPVGWRTVRLTDDRLRTTLFERLDAAPATPLKGEHLSDGPEPFGGPPDCPVRVEPAAPARWWRRLGTVDALAQSTRVARGAELKLGVTFETLRGERRTLDVPLPRPDRIWFEPNGKIVRGDPRCQKPEMGAPSARDGMRRNGDNGFGALELFAPDAVRAPTGKDVLQAEVALDVAHLKSGQAALQVASPTEFLNPQGQLVVDVELYGAPTGLWDLEIQVGDVEHVATVETLGLPKTRFADDPHGETARLRALLAPKE